ncbi:MAG: Beta-glucosidase A [Candidatus Moranbacteria bacterium GW2011_GWE2_35_2-]|nr:MAG: Beta-glucosidase A [Candidatus Moranbacteria bacterium GW2011_GWE2_35_2-]KKQ22073.1 MAG: Beta-glucosidase A [Candidatus Moranbacteria bacterium GW2011_GWF2_37_11]KKQ29174.1 MAG: Beta-glucosidase A [Candidatus Moranbacteria bacterium GW2011_GWD1_37_17]KKQ31159.1 MAG: Beta-glucosidase A [Candidatus Moranbacteria bacterium GW2011_GWE1_37_24]KKQ47409.1 MAG: Beta-glucosidase A [Candidatus Moranbacteria bacterium GW2011_GWD2_37_9]
MYAQSENKKLKFPKGFLWGTAISAYQVEGNNTHADWWKWEQKGKIKIKSGNACDYYRRFKSDHDFLQELGCNTFRLSVEWARVEPEEGKFSKKELAHYREVLLDLKKRDIKIQLTLWWWTSPIWFSEKYGFHKKKSVEVFARYAQKVVDELGDLIDIYQTFNEPMVPLGQGYLSGQFPPGIRNPWKLLKAANNIAKAHKRVYEIIKNKYPEVEVGISYLYNWYESENLGFLIAIVNRVSKWFRVDLIDGKIGENLDFIGVQYYRLGKIKYDWGNMGKLDAKNQIYYGFTIEEDKNNLMKWISYPEGIYRVLTEIKKNRNTPIYITENGVPTDVGLNDQERIVFIKEHLKYMHKAISEGVDVRGYNHWSLLDNFEWLYGYTPRFGLVEIDFSTMERKPRKSFYEYAKICKNNELDLN